MNENGDRNYPTLAAEWPAWCGGISLTDIACVLGLKPETLIPKLRKENVNVSDRVAADCMDAICESLDPNFIVECNRDWKTYVYQICGLNQKRGQISLCIPMEPKPRLWWWPRSDHLLWSTRREKLHLHFTQTAMLCRQQSTRNYNLCFPNIDKKQCIEDMHMTS